MTDRYWLARAWTGTDLVDGLVVTVRAGRFDTVAPGPPVDATMINGLTLPGLANGHSHAFHRALRGRTQTGAGTFWTWRDQMYALAARLDPDGYHHLAGAVFAEMVATGFTTVGEFHYLHHDRDGRTHADANAMGEAVISAAAEAGLRICLLDTCYLGAGIGHGVEGVQRRFSDGTVEHWADRAGELADRHHGSDVVRIGAAVHSVRAVPRAMIGVVAEWAADRSTPLHVHLSEQVAENEECAAAYGLTPTGVLAEAGALTDRTSVVHATHLTPQDVQTLGAAAVTACLCPTTEADLGDGIGPSVALRGAGARVSIGTDSHALIDAFSELRAVEHQARLADRSRGRWTAAALLKAGGADGHRSLGFDDAGRIAPGQRADLVSLDLTSAATAGTGGGPETAVFAATAADVRQVMIDGVIRFVDGDRVELGRRLDDAITRAWAST